MDKVVTGVSAASVMFPHEEGTGGLIPGSVENWTPLVGIIMNNMIIGIN